MHVGGLVFVIVDGLSRGWFNRLRHVVCRWCFHVLYAKEKLTRSEQRSHRSKCSGQPETDIRFKGGSRNMAVD